MEVSDSDPFDSLLSLEQQYHTEGYNLGYADGSKAGRIEGRVFGLEKGFEKFLDPGRLNGRAAVWQARLPPTQDSPSVGGEEFKVQGLNDSDRLRKHIRRLGELTDPEELSTENSEDAVQDVDERVKDAKAKATLISRIVGENDDLSTSGGNAGSAATTTDAAGPTRRGVRVKPDQAQIQAKSGEMEDFGGLPRGMQK